MFVHKEKNIYKQRAHATVCSADIDAGSCSELLFLVLDINLKLSILLYCYYEPMDEI